ncbi:hypothetical protein GCM10017772_28830 [Promicromonospora soli]|uniref:Uncharacterized protein n=1 Tax=Promicromonospora soli TaxID=2035533 RepID=A0A919FZ59_9MICO|nr:hypothetical protein GCM10017772_28830 [Promicromonospora soli]
MLHRELLVEKHSDQEGERVVAQQPVRVGVAGDPELGGHEPIVAHGIRRAPLYAGAVECPNPEEPRTDDYLVA